jgi:uncharacterized SAM-binding protein YcdF (DUF218 family)
MPVYSADVYTTYKFFTSLLMPEGWITGLLIASILLSWSESQRRKRWARRLAVTALLLLYLLSIRPVSYAMTASLERRFPPPQFLNTQQFDAIVVLGGGVRPEGGTRPVADLGTSSLRRVVCGIYYYRQGLAPFLVLSGGNGNPYGDAPLEAEEMQRAAMLFGVPPSALLLEPNSRTTSENAVNTKLLLDDRSRILLVTSALAMPRAFGAFAHQGFTVTPAPCDYIAGELNLHVGSFIPDANDLAESKAAIHEYLGLAFYSLTGRM